MDLEERARALFKKGIPRDEILRELALLTENSKKAEAIIVEIENTENITEDFVRELCTYHDSNTTAGLSGLGCRGAGDFFIHHKIAELINNQETIIDPQQQDDAGVVQVGEDYIAVAVDGMHSRLSHFPFLAGFHVARAAIRDIIVMGCKPKALLSDIHLANDGDVAKIFDYTTGIATVSELTNIPLIAGSTLRIGGDLVLGDRLTGCVGCVGFGDKITPRQGAKPKDVIIMTEGSGGGTIATTALYNGFSEVVAETLNLNFITLGQKLLNTDLLKKVHTLTDVTNGGLRGDAFEIAKTANVSITLFEEQFRKLVNIRVLEMLEKLEIDLLGISIDSLLLIVDEHHSEQILEFIRNNGSKAEIIGYIEEYVDHEPVVRLIKGACDNNTIKGNNITHINQDMTIIELTPKFREAPYTPIKKVVDVVPRDLEQIQRDLEKAAKISLNKKEKLKSWISAGKRV